MSAEGQEEDRDPFYWPRCTKWRGRVQIMLLNSNGLDILDMDEIDHRHNFCYWGPELNQYFGYGKCWKDNSVIKTSISFMGALMIQMGWDKVLCVPGVKGYHFAKESYSWIITLSMVNQNSAIGNQLFHFLGLFWMLHLRNISMHWFTRSVWPSVWGW